MTEKLQFTIGLLIAIFFIILVIYIVISDYLNTGSSSYKAEDTEEDLDIVEDICGGMRCLGCGPS